MNGKPEDQTNAAARLCFLAFLSAAAVTWMALGLSRERASAATALAGPARPITVHNATDDDLARLREALGMFADAGLELPPVQIHFGSSRERCKGHDGLFQVQFAPWRVLVCSERPYLLIHELAHAWIEAETTESIRRRFMDFREISRWNDRGDDWSDRGVEDAAFIIQTNLMTENPPLRSKRWTKRRDAFELLTGRTSPMDLPRSSAS